LSLKLKGGDTFRLVGVADRHTWVVLTDPEKDPSQILIVSFTSFTPRIGMDESCVVEPREYSILVNKSCIYYEDIKELSLDNLEALAAAGKLQTRTPIPAALLQRIRDGAKNSDDCKEKYKQVLRKQELIS
jgi:hypothetical protein